MADNKKDEKIDNLNEDVEYQFEDDSQFAGDDYEAVTEDLGETPKVAEAAAPVAAEGPAAVPATEGLRKYKKPVVMVLGVLLLTGVVFFLLGNGAKRAPVDTQFTLEAEKASATAGSSFASDTNSATPTQEDFLAEAGSKAPVKKALVKTMEEAPIKKEITEQVVPKVNQEEMNKRIDMAMQATQREWQRQLSEVVTAFSNQQKQLRAELQKRYDSALSLTNDKIVQLEQENIDSVTEIRTLTARLMEQKEQMAVLRKQMDISFDNQKRIMYNQGMSFDASGAAIIRAGNDEVPAATVLQKSIKDTITYNVQAVVPGRAWLMSNTGTSFSVAIGDKVEGLGVIVDIDALNGIVATSSGKLLTTH